MDCLNDLATISCFSVARKKRSNFHRRRPHPDPKLLLNYLNVFTVRSLPTDYGGHETINLHCSSGNLKIVGDIESCDNKSYANKQVGSDRSGNGSKLKKLKLTLDGVTRTLHTTPTIGVKQGSGSLKSFDSSGVFGAHPKQDISRSSVHDAKGKFSRRCTDLNSDVMYKMGHRSRRSTKKSAVDEEFDDEDDEEIRYLKKLKASKIASGYVVKQEEPGRKNKAIANRMCVDHDDTKDGNKKSRIYKLHNDNEMALSSDDELKGIRNRLAGDCIDPAEREMTMTTRKRALECPESGGLVEFPNGLPDAPSKKQKLSEVEQQLRKAEITQRRKFLAEQAAKEAEADAIRKILGQDSSRKKEEKLKKQQEALAQERMDRTAALGPNTVRWIMGPHGTVVIFSEDMGIPKILDSMPCRYPPPREKCVGPNCTNDYKYRDSKSKLPLCSLHCYKAVRGNVDLLPAC